MSLIFLLLLSCSNPASSFVRKPNIDEQARNQEDKKELKDRIVAKVSSMIKQNILASVSEEDIKATYDKVIEVLSNKSVLTLEEDALVQLIHNRAIENSIEDVANAVSSEIDTFTSYLLTDYQNMNNVSLFLEQYYLLLSKDNLNAKDKEEAILKALDLIREKVFKDKKSKEVLSEDGIKELQRKFLRISSIGTLRFFEAVGDSLTKTMFNAKEESLAYIILSMLTSEKIQEFIEGNREQDSGNNINIVISVGNAHTSPTTPASGLSALNSMPSSGGSGLGVLRNSFNPLQKLCIKVAEAFWEVNNKLENNKERFVQKLHEEINHEGLFKIKLSETDISNSLEDIIN